MRTDQRRLPQARGVWSRVENLRAGRRNGSHTLILTVAFKRQVTLPSRVLDAMGVGLGPRLQLTPSSDGYLLRPRRIDYSRLGTLRD